MPRANRRARSFAASLGLLWNPPAADHGLTPNALITDANGDRDYARSSWSTANGSLSAGFARSSWSCTCSLTSAGTIDPSRSSWSSNAWSTYFGL